ncbi:hypothetical protein Syun_004294 [Stephania yunnanensis]|uniref:Beta-glucosidase n=1 Tax=Stephania yunnanensis TaxID=152371 RepID=A0AAP0L2S5_9MAGN
MLDFHLGWFLDPVVYGDYPASMKNIVGSRLPLFTENDSKQLKSSFDFIGLNHYSSLPVEDLPITFSKYGSDYAGDTSVKGFFSKSVLRRGPPTSPFNQRSLQRLLEYVNVKYKNPSVVIHENGLRSDGDNCNAQALNDTERIKYLQSYIGSLLFSIRNGSDVRGYFVWSFMDCFELLFGYKSHYGLYAVDFKDTKRKRYPRMSARWFSSFLAKENFMLYM